MGLFQLWLISSVTFWPRTQRGQMHPGCCQTAEGGDFQEHNFRPFAFQSRSRPLIPTHPHDRPPLRRWWAAWREERLALVSCRQQNTWHCFHGNRKALCTSSGLFPRHSLDVCCSAAIYFVFFCLFFPPLLFSISGDGAPGRQPVVCLFADERSGAAGWQSEKKETFNGF